jgi:methionyl-tRNA formyltransferase
VQAVDPSVVVACGRGALELVEVQPAGKPRMPAAAFARGHQIAGAVLGDRG